MPSEKDELDRGMLEHWASIRGQHVAIIEFIDFINGKGIRLDFEDATEGTSLTLADLVDDFLEVDRKQLEQERRELLARIQNHG